MTAVAEAQPTGGEIAAELSTETLSRRCARQLAVPRVRELCSPDIAACSVGAIHVFAPNAAELLMQGQLQCEGGGAE